jgi:hypothetical protein
LTAADLDRIAYVEDSDIRVRFCNALIPNPPSSLIFYIDVSNHFGMPPSDFTQTTWVGNSAGAQNHGAWAWTGTDLTIQEHHAAGRLTGPSTDHDGGALIDAGTAWIDLHLAFGESGAMVPFRWEKRFLP